MGRVFFRLVALSFPVLMVTATITASGQETGGALETPEQKFSYMMGMDVANSIKKVGADVDLEIFMQGLKAVLEGEQTQLTPEEAAEIKQTFLQQRREQAVAERKALGEKNLEEGEKFLEQNKSKDGVETTASGLQYAVIKEGSGPKPKATDTVSVHYRGTLLDGAEFDSSHSRGEPATFPLNGVIPGWSEGVQLMPVGSTYRFFVPAGLAYGERGAGAQIGPNATLIFEVELLSIEGE